VITERLIIALPSLTSCLRLYHHIINYEFEVFERKTKTDEDKGACGSKYRAGK